MSRGLRWLLSVSIAVNVLAGAVAAYWLHEHGWHDAAIKLHLAHNPPPNYPVLARERFGWQPSTGIVVAGDSQVQNAPLADLIADFHQRGIGGQTIEDLAAWLPRSLDASTRRVVIEAGTNNVLQGLAANASAADYARMLDAVHAAAPSAQIVMLSVPPISDYPDRVRALNAALARLAGRDGARWVDITTPVQGPDGRYVTADTMDGTHLSLTGYLRLASVLRQATG